MRLLLPSAETSPDIRLFAGVNEFTSSLKLKSRIWIVEATGKLSRFSGAVGLEKVRFGGSGLASVIVPVTCI
jgi:hypothetical protein